MMSAVTQQILSEVRYPHLNTLILFRPNEMPGLDLVGNTVWRAVNETIEDAEGN